MKTLDEYFYEADAATSKDPVTYHRIAEAFKHAYGQRTKLGDPKFVPEVREVGRRMYCATAPANPRILLVEQESDVGPDGGTDAQED